MARARNARLPRALNSIEGLKGGVVNGTERVFREREQ